MTPTQPDIKSPFRLGDWHVLPSLNRITSGPTVVSVEPRVMDVLVRLAETPGEVVRREQLQEDVWSGTVVNEEALTRAISELRKALGDDPKQPAYVETIRGAGYRLIAPVDRHVFTDIAPAVDPKIGRRRAAALVAASVLIGLALVAVAVETRSDSPAPLTAAPLTTLEGSEINPALSPDGSRVAYAWDGEGSFDLYVKQSNSEEHLRLTDHEGYESAPAWSPDGSTIAYFSSSGGRYGIYTIPAMGGRPRLLIETAHWVESLDWSPDGRYIALSTRLADTEPMRLFRLDVSSPAMTPLTAPSPHLSGDVSPAYSPDGRRIAFVRRERAGTHDVFLLDDGEIRRLTHGELGLRGLDWVSDSELVISSFRAGTYGLWRLDVDTGDMTWVPVRGERIYNPTVGGGDLVYAELTYEKNVWSITRGADGGIVTNPIIVSTRWDCEAYFSPDGRRLVFTSARSGHLELWLGNADGTDLSQITHFEGPFVGNPRWSPDGRRIAFYASPEGRSIAYVLDVESQRAEPLTEATYNSWVTGWTNDGRWIYVASDRGGSWQIWKIPSDSQGDAVLVTDGIAASESPDGNYLYYVRPDEEGLWRSSLRDGVLFGPEERILDTLDASDWSNWTVHDEGIYFIDRRSGGPAVAYLDLESRTIETIAPLPNIASPSLAVSPDGKTILYARIERVNSDLMLAEEVF